MIEWQVIEHKDQVAWSQGGGSSPQRPRPGLLNYIVAGITLIATGVLAFFAFSFVLLIIVPVLLIGGAVMAWKWRRLIKAHQEQFRRKTPRPEQNPTQRPFTAEDQGDVIDV